jgi:hypothetical protein
MNYKTAEEMPEAFHLDPIQEAVSRSVSLDAPSRPALLLC